MTCGELRFSEEAVFVSSPGVNGTPIFTQRVIQPRKEVTEVETPADALPVSLAERGKVDLPYMAALSGATEEELTAQLKGQIYQDAAMALML